MHTLNIGILAHVDAGKTSLTERLLYATGTIDRLGSVDAGDTRTDTGAIERERGITIRSAVASFTAGDVQVNLIDTPGHSDFIAEVERALGVLDGAVLLLSAVEGVQARTRVLMKTLRRLRLPTLLFVNKIDRAGARTDALVADIRRALAPHVVPMTAVHDPGTPDARTAPLCARTPAVRARLTELLADADERILARAVDGPPPTPDELRAALAARTADGSVHPLYFGSAIGGQGVGALVDGMTRLIPPVPGTPDAPPRGTVFAVQREPGGGKSAYLRLYDGALRPRGQITLHRREPDGTAGRVEGRITALEVVGRPPGDREPLTAGNIAVLRGLPGVRVGDRLGGEAPGAHQEGDGALFSRPTLETLVRARRPAEAARLHAALLLLAEQDPLIHARPAAAGATSVLLYGEVQKEIIAATLLQDHGIAADFEPSRVVCVERLLGTGEAYEEITGRDHVGWWATVGLRVEPGPRGSGPRFAYETELGALPHGFHQAVEDTVYASLRTGPRGWAVTDCRVVLTRSGFVGPVSTAGDFRGVTPVVLARALRRAGTRVYEPCHSFEAEVPPDTIAPVTAQLASLGAEFDDTSESGGAWLLTGTLPARRVPDFERRLPGLTRGEGTWWSQPSGPAGDRPAPEGAPYAAGPGGSGGPAARAATPR
ncbi:GTP-binding protein [Streptomyces sp. CB02923]|uniref:tetracycline resistance ribosomal protection protein Otr(A) n=1 Tax=Streptomyces sp. CB02923 TaxID=1718985 RepID=UPI0009389A92|nr:tetracycline resistance ribosomal protection protein Otr(A) [Streptomyces sp. CB02923]OKI01132.1 GTP-binding protein [Streptomyces sp. CB02923]